MIAFSPTTISSQSWIKTFIYRTGSTLNTRHFNHKDIFSLQLRDVHHIVSYDVVTNLLAVVHHSPEGILHLYRICQSILHVERMVTSFFHTK